MCVPEIQEPQKIAVPVYAVVQDLQQDVKDAESAMEIHRQFKAITTARLEHVLKKWAEVEVSQAERRTIVLAKTKFGLTNDGLIEAMKWLERCTEALELPGCSQESCIGEIQFQKVLKSPQ